MNIKKADGLGTQIRRLIELLDGDVEAIYQQNLPNDAPEYVPRYTPIMKALASGEPTSIKTIAAQSSISHSAASQTMSKMKQLGLVDTRVDVDSRYRLVYLTAAGEKLLPALQQQWQATTKAAIQLDRELPYPLSQMLEEAIEHLEAKPFKNRIEDMMKQPKS